MAEGSPTLTRMPSLANWVNPSASVSPRPSRESVSPEREQDTGITLIPTGRFGFPDPSYCSRRFRRKGSKTRRARRLRALPPEFAGVFKPRIKPKLPLDHVVMMHQAYVETNPVPKSWDEGPPLDNGGGVVRGDFGREGRAQEGRGAS